MALPVVIATNGFGTPVTEAALGLGLPVVVAANGLGLPVVVVANGMGMPVTFEGATLAAPVILSSPTQTIAENVPFALSLVANQVVTWSVVGGADAALFGIAGSTVGASALDYEIPTDANANNVYEFTVRATGAGGSTDQAMTLTVTNVDEIAPTITSSSTPSVAENAVLAHALTANETVTWSIVGGADQAKFEIVSGSTLRFLANVMKDFELPDDANADNAYIVQVRATDTAGNVTNQTITVSVTNVAEGGGDTMLTWTNIDGVTADGTGGVSGTSGYYQSARTNQTILTTGEGFEFRWDGKQCCVSLDTGTYVDITGDQANAAFPYSFVMAGSGTSCDFYEGTTYRASMTGMTAGSTLVALQVDAAGKILVKKGGRAGTLIFTSVAGIASNAHYLVFRAQGDTMGRSISLGVKYT